MWPFKSKYDKLTREEVVDAICKLEKESQDIEGDIVLCKKQIEELMEKGRTEADRDLKLLYAKKINALKSESAQYTQRAMYLLYNIQMLNKLKKAIDDNQFFKNTTKTSLDNLLGDQKGLAEFLNKVLETRIASEQTLTDADEIFKITDEAYESNDIIYGVNDDDDSLLAMFEIQNTLEEENEFFSPSEAKENASQNDSEEA